MRYRDVPRPWKLKPRPPKRSTPRYRANDKYNRDPSLVPPERIAELWAETRARAKARRDFYAAARLLIEVNR